MLSLLCANASLFHSADGNAYVDLTTGEPYNANRRSAIGDAIDADPLTMCVRAIMAEDGPGQARHPICCVLLPLSRRVHRQGSQTGQKNPRALAGRLRRSQPIPEGNWDRNRLQPRRTFRPHHHHGFG
jgi:hypothetical protein